MIPAKVRRVVDWVLGLSFIGAGVVMGFIPILQGWVLVLAGLAILSSHSRLAHVLLERLKKAGRSIRDHIASRERQQ
jgi:hypothetical protein